MPNINKEIIPIIFSERGENSEKLFQKKLKEIFFSFGLREIKSNLITNEFFSFDLLGFPQYSMLRTNKNIVYVENGEVPVVKNVLFEKIRKIHKKRFGYNLDRKTTEQKMLLSHTTSTIVEFLMNFGVQELFVISKTFRGKSERKEKTQIDICLYNRTLPEVIAFMENSFEIILHKKIKIELNSDFYFFCEPSFSFSTNIDGRKIMLGSGGFLRHEISNLINRKNLEVNNIIVIGFPYQKILNLILGLEYNNWNVDYNYAKNICQL